MHFLSQSLRPRNIFSSRVVINLKNARYRLRPEVSDVLGIVHPASDCNFFYLMLRPLQFDSLIYGSAERSFCICEIKIKIFIFIFITAPIKHFNDRPKKIASGKKTS